MEVEQAGSRRWAAAVAAVPRSLLHRFVVPVIEFGVGMGAWIDAWNRYPSGPLSLGSAFALRRILWSREVKHPHPDVIRQLL